MQVCFFVSPATNIVTKYKSIPKSRIKHLPWKIKNTKDKDTVNNHRLCNTLSNNFQRRKKYLTSNVGLNSKQFRQRFLLYILNTFMNAYTSMRTIHMFFQAINIAIQQQHRNINDVDGDTCIQKHNLNFRFTKTKKDKYWQYILIWKCNINIYKPHGPYFFSSKNEPYKMVWKKTPKTQVLIKNKSCSRYFRLKAVLPHGRTQITETSQRILKVSCYRQPTKVSKEVLKSTLERRN